MKLYSRNNNEAFSSIPKKDFGRESLEKTLEDWLAANPHILGDNILLIGRQVKTPHGIIDLLALDSSGNLLVIELKRGRTSRKIVGQLNSYLTITAKWSENDLVRNANLIKSTRKSNNLIKSFEEYFGCANAPEFNREQIGIVVAESFDSDFADQIGGLRFTCMALQFSNFSDSEGKEYLLVDTISDTTRATANLPKERRNTNSFKKRQAYVPVIYPRSKSQWNSRVDSWLQDKLRIGRKYVTTAEICNEVMGSNQVSRSVSVEIANIMRGLGWRSSLLWLKGKPVRVYIQSGTVSNREDADDLLKGLI